MKSFNGLFLLSLSLLTMACGKAPNSVINPSAHPSLQGSWQLTTLKCGSNLIPTSDLWVFNFSGGQLTRIRNGFQLDSRAYTQTGYQINLGAQGLSSPYTLNYHWEGSSLAIEENIFSTLCQSRGYQGASTGLFSRI